MSDIPKSLQLNIQFSGAAVRDEFAALAAEAELSCIELSRSGTGVLFADEFSDEDVSTTIASVLAVLAKLRAQQ